MGRQTILVLRTVLVALLAGSVMVQVVFVPLLYIDMRELDPDLAYVRVPLVVIAILAVLAAQAVLVCVWKLTSMVRRRHGFLERRFPLRGRHHRSGDGCSRARAGVRGAVGHHQPERAG